MLHDKPFYMTSRSGNTPDYIPNYLLTNQELIQPPTIINIV